MSLNSKRISQIILGITSIVLSRTMLVSLNDPEGPNLLIVMVMAAIVFAPSWFVYSRLKQDGLKNLSSPLFIQIIFVVGLYFFLK